MAGSDLVADSLMALLDSVRRCLLSAVINYFVNV